MKVNVKVNGVTYERDVEPRTLLAYFLREDCGLTGTHVGCDTSSCGCCVVVMDGGRAGLMATDPPYYVGYTGRNHPGKASTMRASKNKDWTDTYGLDWDDAAANPELYEKFLALAVAKAIAPRAAWYVWHASRRQAMLEAAMQKAGALVHCQIIWHKNRRTRRCRQ